MDESAGKATYLFDHTQTKGIDVTNGGNTGTWWLYPKLCDSILSVSFLHDEINMVIRNNIVHVILKSLVKTIAVTICIEFFFMMMLLNQQNL